MYMYVCVCIYIYIYTIILVAPPKGTATSCSGSARPSSWSPGMIIILSSYTIILLLLLSLLIMLLSSLLLLLLLSICYSIGPESGRLLPGRRRSAVLERGDDAVGNPHRAQISQFQLFQLILLSKLDKQFYLEPFEATVSQSRAPSPPSQVRLLGAGGARGLARAPRGRRQGRPRAPADRKLCYDVM